jgi:hypothetical protein
MMMITLLLTGFLMQIDKLVQLLESPIFVHLRLQMLDVESPHHAPLLKSCYGLLMLLPQSDAFRSLNDRLTAVCNLRDNLGIPPTISASEHSPQGPLSKRQRGLLAHFDKVMNVHRKLRGREQQFMTGEHLRDTMSRSCDFSAKWSGRIIAGAAAGTSAEGVVGAPSAPTRGRITQEV